MRISIKIFISFTILMLVFTIFSIINLNISMKYEVEEPTAMGKVTELVIEKAKDIKSLMFYLWTFLAYQVTTLILLFTVLSNFKDRG
jgi:Na+/H+ antiporter NhaC